MLERARFEREMEILLGVPEDAASEFEILTPANRTAQQAIKFWALLPHTIDVGAGPVPLEPSRLTLSFYAPDGQLFTTPGFKISSTSS